MFERAMIKYAAFKLMARVACMDTVLTDNHPVERKGSRDISQVHIGAYIGKMGEGFREYTAI